MYSPFDNSIDEVTIGDLRILRETQEGWYVEYKRLLVSPKVAGKSLSAFANSFGGWLFYGVAESADGTRVAGTFSGIPVANVPQVETWLRQAASSQVSPAPFYRHKILYGPDEELGLVEGHAIIVVHVPQGNNAPYLHSSGKFYRRVADESDPIAETDRHFLDLLWQRGKEHERRFERSIGAGSTLSTTELSSPILTLHFFADPFGDRGITTSLDFQSFASLMNDQNKTRPGVPFDTVHTLSDGFIARQLLGSDPHNQTLTWEYRSDCSSRVTVPLSTLHPVDLERSAGYKWAREFAGICEERNLQDFLIVDLSLTFVLLQAVVAQLRRVLKAEQISLPISGKIRVTGTKNKVPFLDVPTFVKFTRNFGVPIILEDDCYAPPGTRPDTCLSFGCSPDSIQGEDDPEEFAYLIDAALLISDVFRGFGVPKYAFGCPFGETDIGFEQSEWLTDLHRTGERARITMKARAEEHQRETGNG